jgi:hypothetical protein
VVALLLAWLSLVGETHHVRGGFAFGVLALAFAALVQALDAERGNLFGDGLVDLALDPHEGPVLVLELLVGVLLRHLEQLGHLLELGEHLGAAAFDVFGNGPAGRHQAGREDEPVAVEDAAAVGKQRFDGTAICRLD